MTGNWMFSFDRIIAGDVEIRIMRCSSVNYPDFQQDCDTSLHDSRKAQA